MITDAPKDQFDITWHDSGREPQGKRVPAYPNGIDVNRVRAGRTGCRVPLPYPATRIGQYLVVCQRCRGTVVVNTTGRADDPRSVATPCIGLAE